MSNKARNSAELTELRAAAGERAAADPRNKRVVELRKLIVELKEAGVSLPEDPGAPLDDQQSLLQSALTERAALQEAIWAECMKLSDERGRAVRVERQIAATLLADKFAKLDDEELEKALQNVTSKQRELKIEKRALRVVIDSRAAQKKARELVAKMSAEERAEMAMALAQDSGE